MWDTLYIRSKKTLLINKEKHHTKILKKFLQRKFLISGYIFFFFIPFFLLAISPTLSSSQSLYKLEESLEDDEDILVMVPGVQLVYKREKEDPAGDDQARGQ